MRVGKGQVSVVFTAETAETAGIAEVLLEVARPRDLRFGGELKKFGEWGN